MCVMGLQAEQAVDSWVVDDLGSHGENGETSEDSSDVSTIASVHGDPFSLLDMMSAVKLLLEGLGEDVTRDGLLKTPLRVAQAFQGATKGYRQSAKDVVGGALFMEPGAGGGQGNGSGGGCGGMVVVRNVDLFALCESCLLPFRIRCHIAYVPVGERVVGLSKLPRVAELIAKKLQNPQRFAEEVVVSLSEALQPEPLGVAVLVESWHLQWPGASESGTVSELEKCVGWVPSTAYAGTGQFADTRDALWDELMALLQLNGHSVASRSHLVPPCPFTLFDPIPSSSSSSGNSYSNGGGGGYSVLEFLSPVRDCSVPALASMVDAVETLLRSVGEDPSRPALRFTSPRFVRWLLTSTQGSRAGTSGNLDLVAGMLSVVGAGGGEDDVPDDGDATILTEFNFPFCSQCEHHLLPFVGVVHVACLARRGRGWAQQQPQLDRESLQRVVRGYSLRLQVQERLTREIAEAIGSSVMVVVEASHLCMLSRGVQQVDSLTSTYASLGRFATNARLRTAFLQLVAKRTHT